VTGDRGRGRCQRSRLLPLKRDSPRQVPEAEVPHRGSIGAHPAMPGRPSKACRQVGLVPQSGSIWYLFVLITSSKRGNTSSTNFHKNLIIRHLSWVCNGHRWGKVGARSRALEEKAETLKTGRGSRVESQEPGRVDPSKGFNAKTQSRRKGFNHGLHGFNGFWARRGADPAMRDQATLGASTRQAAHVAATGRRAGGQVSSSKFSFSFFSGGETTSPPSTIQETVGSGQKKGGGSRPTP
jgi:hypothetical protein